MARHESAGRTARTLAVARRNPHAQPPRHRADLVETGRKKTHARGIVSQAHQKMKTRSWAALMRVARRRRRGLLMEERARRPAADERSGPGRGGFVGDHRLLRTPRLAPHPLRARLFHPWASSQELASSPRKAFSFFASLAVKGEAGPEGRRFAVLASTG